MSKGVSNENYLKRNERLRKVGELMEKGVAPRDICTDLGLQWETVKSDINLITVLNEGSLTPEICAEKRVEIDKGFLKLDDDAYEDYTAMMYLGKYKEAVAFLKLCIEIKKIRAKLWGLEQEAGPAPVITENLSFHPGIYQQ